jgi:hypothetical protein
MLDRFNHSLLLTDAQVLISCAVEYPRQPYTRYPPVTELEGILFRQTFSEGQHLQWALADVCPQLQLVQRILVVFSYSFAVQGTLPTSPLHNHTLSVSA